MNSTKHFGYLSASVRDVFRRFHRRKRWFLSRAWLMRLTMVYLGLVLAATHLDRFCRFGVSARTVAVVCVHGAILSMAGVAFLYYRRKARVTATLAYEVQTSLGDKREHWVAAYALLAPEREAGHESPLMKRILADHAEEVAQGLQRQPQPRDRWVSAHVVGLVLCAGVCAALLAFPAYEFPLMLARLFQPRAALPKPSLTKIHVESFTNPSGQGDDVTIFARLSGRMAKEAWMLLSPGAGALKKEKMIRIGKDTHLYTFYGVRTNLSFHIRAGDGETQDYHLDVVEQPRVERLTVEVAPPAYASLPPVVMENPMEIRALAGSTVLVHFACSQILRSSEVVVAAEDGSEARIPAAMTHGVGSWVVKPLKQDLLFKISVRNTRGFENLDQDERQILCIRDKPPEVKIEGGQEIVSMYPTEERAFDVSAEDDLGLVDLTASFDVNPNPDNPVEPRRVRFKSYTPPGLKVYEHMPVSLERLNVRPGDVVELRVEGMDTLKSFGRSNRLRIQVVSFDPGIEEQERIQMLRFMAAVALALAPSPGEAQKGGPLGLVPETAQALTALAKRLGVEEPAISGSAVIFLERLLDEQDLTPFYAYKSDLRSFLAMAQMGLLSDAHQASRVRIFGSLAKETLPAQIRFRFSRNLLRALGAFRAEIERFAAPASAMETVNIARRHVDQIRISLEKWMGYLADISRESGLPEYRFELFAKDIEDINTLAYGLKPGSKAAADDLRAAIGRLMDRTQRLLPRLASDLEKARNDVDAGFEKDREEFLNALAQGRQDLGAAREIARLSLESMNRDASLPPEAKLGMVALHRAVMADPMNTNMLAIGRASWAWRSPYLAMATCEYREQAFACLCAKVRSGDSAGAWNRDYDLREYLAEHERMLRRAWPEYAPQKRSFASLEKESSALCALAHKQLGAPGDLVMASAGGFCEAVRGLARELSATEALLASRVPESTVEERRRIVSSYDKTVRQGDVFIEALRMCLTAGLLQGSDIALDTRAAWTRALVRLQGRMDHFVLGSAETMGVLRGFQDKPLDARENAALPVRLQALSGAFRGLQQLSEGLEAIQKREKPGADFMAEEARQLPAAQQIEKMQRESVFLYESGAQPASETAAGVLALLNEGPELRNTVVAEYLSPRMETLRARFAAANAMVKDKKAGAALAVSVATMRRDIGDLLERLDRFENGEKGNYAESLARIMERLRPLPLDVPGIDKNLALFAFTFVEAGGVLDRLHRDLVQAERNRAPIPLVNRSAGLTERARAEAQAQFSQAAQQWQLDAARRFLAYLDGGGTNNLSPAAFGWQAVVNLNLSPAMLRRSGAVLPGNRGKAMTERRHWLVDEFEESRRLSLPRRHKTQMREYYERLQNEFRAHEDTR